MYGTMSMEILEQRREEMLREAQLHRLGKALRADRKRRAGYGGVTAWELARVAGLLLKFFRWLKNAR